MFLFLSIFGWCGSYICCCRRRFLVVVGLLVVVPILVIVIDLCSCSGSYSVRCFVVAAYSLFDLSLPRMP